MRVAPSWMRTTRSSCPGWRTTISTDSVTGCPRAPASRAEGPVPGAAGGLVVLGGAVGCGVWGVGRRMRREELVVPPQLEHVAREGDGVSDLERAMARHPDTVDEHAVARP